MTGGGEKKKKEGKKEVSVPSAQDPNVKGKKPKRSPAGSSGDAVRVFAKDGEFYAKILKAMKAKVNPQSAEVVVLSIRRTRRDDILLVSAFEKALDQAIGERDDVKVFGLKEVA